MASVQEVVEQLLDSKLSKLIEERREEAAVEERNKYQRRLFVAVIIGIFLLGLTFVNGYRTSYILKNNLYSGCTVRQVKDPAVENLAQIYLNQEEAHALPEGTLRDLQNQRIAALKQLRDAYRTVPDCNKYKN